MSSNNRFEQAPLKLPFSHAKIILEHPRLGLTVAKKHLKRAHDRNRIKRLVRESFRLSQHNLPSCDFVFVAKRGIGQLDNQTFLQTLDKLWARHIRLAQKSSSL